MHIQIPGLRPKLLIDVLLVVSLLCFMLWQRDPFAAEENGVMEAAQTVLLFLTCIPLGMQALQLKRSSVEFAVLSSLGLLILLFALRELDISSFGDTEFWMRLELAVQFGKKALGLLLLGFVLLHLRQILAARLQVMSMPVVMLGMGAALLIFGGVLFDKNVFAISESATRFVEELMELNAYIILFAGAMAKSAMHHGALSTGANGAG